MVPVFSMLRNQIDVDSIVMGSNRHVISIWRIRNDFIPLIGSFKGNQALREIVVVKDVHIAVIITHCHMTVNR